uniref:Transmembrane protein n=1 Tax=Haemonchus contortus TaxID=6289 RepID=A0A7I4YML5_HAECO
MVLLQSNRGGARDQTGSSEPSTRRQTDGRRPHGYSFTTSTIYTHLRRFRFIFLADYGFFFSSDMHSLMSIPFTFYVFALFYIDNGWQISGLRLLRELRIKRVIRRRRELAVATAAGLTAINGGFANRLTSRRRRQHALWRFPVG